MMQVKQLHDPRLVLFENAVVPSPEQLIAWGLDPESNDFAAKRGLTTQYQGRWYVNQLGSWYTEVYSNLN